MNNPSLKKRTLLYLGPKQFISDIESNFKEYNVFSTIDEIEVDRILDSVSIIIDACLEIKFDKNRLLLARNLLIYATASTGFTHIDHIHLAEQNITLISLKGKKEFLKGITPAAEHSWLLLMMCARKVKSAINDINNDIWERTRYPGKLIKGKTLGLIGVGRIGSWMAKYAEAFGMKCIGYDPDPKDIPGNVKLKPIEELVEEADFISLHVNYEKELDRFISKELINNFKRGSIFINTSRGELVDEDALAKAFLKGDIASIGIDVLTNEQEYKKSNLFKLSKKHDDIIITPHIAGYSPDVFPMVLQYICEQVKIEMDKLK